ncbi:hypothetical protein GCM10011391_19040 [Pullulanibacillus camelliae]|uniref:Uncharacterized protein n=1 Tax=Pullulanibacillus camelliae TaxID=1707096 RepID=A0A8J2YGQ5_9BACL|nr:hypothetical protein GCM10011391_19040 [Pullulanibacillus camelliae]
MNPIITIKSENVINISNGVLVFSAKKGMNRTAPKIHSVIAIITKKYPSIFDQNSMVLLQVCLTY